VQSPKELEMKKSHKGGGKFMVSALLHVMWRKTAMVVTVERWEGTLAGKPTSQRNFLNHFMG
jgi:hypothetical protein